jgi:hypothetical protein
LQTRTHETRSGAPIPADALVFDFSPGLAWMTLGGSLLLLALAVSGAVALTKSHQLILAIAPLLFFGLLSALSLQSFLRLRDSVAVNADGIWYLPRNGECTFLAWRDIARVVANDVQQRLVLIDSSGNRTIRLEYQLKDFLKLREFVLSHTPVQTRLDPNASPVFHRTWISIAVWLVFSVPLLYFAWFACEQGQTGLSIVLGASAMLPLLLILQDPLRLLVEPQELVITYPGWKRIVPFHDIRDISLTYGNFLGNVFAAVVILRLHGKPIELDRFQEGSLALFETLQAAWYSANSASHEKSLQ